MPVLAGTTWTCRPSAISRFPDASTAVPQPPAAALAAGSPLPPPRPWVPTTVVSHPVLVLTRRTSKPSAMYSHRPATCTPHGVTATDLAGPGPPTPPATVVIVPLAAGGAALATGTAATASPPAATAASAAPAQARRRATMATTSSSPAQPPGPPPGQPGTRSAGPSAAASPRHLYDAAASPPVYTHQRR